MFQTFLFIAVQWHTTANLHALCGKKLRLEPPLSVINFIFAAGPFRQTKFSRRSLYMVITKRQQGHGDICWFKKFERYPYIDGKSRQFHTKAQSNSDFFRGCG